MIDQQEQTKSEPPKAILLPCDMQQILTVNQRVSSVLRAGPNVAHTYTRYACGLEARLQVSAAQWSQATQHTRRALQMLLLIGRKPEQLKRVRRALNLTEMEPVTSSTLPISLTSAEALMRWAANLGWGFDQASLDCIAKILNLGPIRRGDLSPYIPFIADAIIAHNEPVHDYTRLYCNSLLDEAHVQNTRTSNMLGAACALRPDLGLHISRGSYRHTQNDADPHNGGGVIDLNIGNPCPSGWVRAVATLRQTGFAAWFRARKNNPHVHAIAIGDRDLTAFAKKQLRAYFSGKDGRSRMGPDPHVKLTTPTPSWVNKYRLGYMTNR